MSQLVTNCPRCGAQRTTFDVKNAHHFDTQYDWQRWFEAFSICRNCNLSTVFVLSQNKIDDTVKRVAIENLTPSVNEFMNIEGFIHIANIATARPPEHLPKEIEAAFNEGATALAVSCYNAAGTMFRLCVDLATRPKLPKEEVAGLHAKTRRDLGLRLPWLFDNGFLPADLRELSSCIKDDGNDGAHTGTLKKTDAEDLLDFTVALLERMYTEPERLRLAKERRADRRGPTKER